MMKAKHTSDRISSSTPRCGMGVFGYYHPAVKSLLSPALSSMGGEGEDLQYALATDGGNEMRPTGIVPAGRRLWPHLLALSAGVIFFAGCHKAYQGRTAAELELPSV